MELGVQKCVSMAVVALLVSLGPAVAAEPAVTGSWQTEEQAKARLVADAGTTAAGERLVGIEIVLAEGWKTYWRTPGTSGVPPSFNWSASMGLASAEVVYPAPRRFEDKDDIAIGYKGRVVWPVLVRLATPAAGARLKLALEIGVCRDVCIPIQVDLALSLPAQAAGRVEAHVAPWLDRVPRTVDNRRPADPEIVAITSHLSDARPHVRVVARYAAPVTDADLFPEAPEGLYVPLPQKAVQPDGRTVAFDIDLSRDVELKDLVGRPLRMTVVGGGAAVETQWVLK